MAMAAPNQPLPGLQVTAPDEDMEISDYERNADDIDIDIDLTVDPSHHEDENMDDDRSEHDSKDDVMLDGDGNDEDGMMQDNMSVPDEHLTDASDVGYLDIDVKEAQQNQPAAEQVDVQVQDSSHAEDFIDYDDTAPVQAQPAPQAAQPSVDHSVAEQTQFPESENPGNQEINVHAQGSEASTFSQPSAQGQTSVSVEAAVEAAVEETSSATSRIEDPVADSSAAQDAGASHVVDDSIDAHSETVPVEPVLDSHTVAVTEDETRLSAEIAENQDQAEGRPHDDQNEKVHGAPELFAEQQAEPEQSTRQSDEALDFSHLPFDPKHDAENQSSHSALSLHPVVVVYQGDEISLFPPHGSDTSDSFYFLHDESLANESIRSLLQACRQVLGETMRDDDELEIDIAELGLCVSEDSDNAASTSFSQVLDVYLQLHQLDGHQSPGPLYMTLNTKTRFSARLNALLAAIADGRGMSQLSFLEDVTEEDVFVGSDNVPEEQDSANQGDEKDGREHADNPIPEHASEHDPSQEAAVRGRLHAEDKQQPEPDSAAIRQIQTDVEDVDAVSQDQGATSQRNEESVSTDQHEPQGYVSPKPEDLPEYESSDEGDGALAQGNGDGVEGDPRVDASGADDLRENDQINYDDGEVAEEVRDDASLRSSTLQGDNTPAAVDDGTSQRQSNASVVPTGISGTLHEEPYNDGRDESASTRKDENSQRDGLHTQADEPAAVTEENQRLEQSIGQDGLENTDETLEQELERELNGPPEPFVSTEGVQGMPDEEHYAANYEEGEEYGFEHDGDVQETQDGEASYEEFVVVEAEDAHENPDAPDDGRAADYQEWSHGDGFDDVEAEQTVENDPGETHSGLGQGLEDNHAGQAEPTAHASDEDELDTIDYDDEELSRPPSAQQDEAAAPSPSSAKRGWEELGQDDEDQADEQAPKKVKSE